MAAISPASTSAVVPPPHPPIGAGAQVRAPTNAWASTDYRLDWPAQLLVGELATLREVEPDLNVEEVAKLLELAWIEAAPGQVEQMRDRSSRRRGGAPASAARRLAHVGAAGPVRRADLAAGRARLLQP